MAKITQDMKAIAAKARPVAFATASKDGKLNVVPLGHVNIISDDEIMLVDLHMHKTRQNLAENPVAAVSFWDTEVHYGYQFKGKARVETSGKLFDETKRWFEEQKFYLNPIPKALVFIKVDEIYYIGAGKDSSINLAK